jgi:hypothetical protein
MPFFFKLCIAILPFLSTFFFPYVFTFVLAFAAGLVFPPLALAAGILLDFLYYTGGWPKATLIGLTIALVAWFVRYFVRTRIM